ncbi:MAG: TolC family protein, partial [Candidatus Deferrimicrobiaceae bacterium]
MIPAILAVALLVPAVAAGGRNAQGNGVLPVPSSVSLFEAVRHALSHSREGRIAEKSVEIAEQGRTRAAAARLPRLDASGDYTSLSEPPSIFFTGGELQIADQNVYHARITADQTIYDFGKTGARVSGAEARVDAAARGAELARERLAV